MENSLLVSTSYDPVMNLALEEWLFTQKKPAESILLLYENTESIICGTFQNPWLECDVDWMQTNSWPVLRRISGGGTVWHDPGNLNISWLGPRLGFDRSSLLTQIQAVLAELGISAEINKRGDILHAGRKLSGNALCYRSDRVLHHATLLLSARLPELRRALNPEFGVWTIQQSHGVASQPAPVTRLVDILHEPDPSNLLQKLRIGFEIASNLRMQEISIPESDPQFLALVEKNLSWEWIFGRTPSFKIINNSDLATEFPAEIEVTNGYFHHDQNMFPFPGFASMNNRKSEPHR